MKKRNHLKGDEPIYIGIDLHKKRWHITIRTADVELFCGSIPGNWESLKKLLQAHRTSRVFSVYEAGCLGFWLHDHLLEHGVDNIVTPPSLLPLESGSRVKTDKRDSRKLAHLLAKGLLKQVYVPSQQERYHRQVVRRRRQLIGDRVRVQNRIKSELLLHGLELPKPTGCWSEAYFENLCRVRFNDRYMQESFNRLLEQYAFLNKQVKDQTKLLQELSKHELYRERVEILLSIPGVGIVAAMELLLELQNVERFRRAEQLAAYIGLTPSQYSSADKIRMGRITRSGKNTLRGTLIQCAWHLIRKDGIMREKYERIKARAGAKRAIVAIARTLLIRMRRLLLDGNPYVIGLTASN